ncbi:MULTISPECIES: endonuclease/exonuclease/phosphatase family protein [unclassified Streptomyces]|uniref:endonuclease/exonuclease/phosphatase family protein n=1 Tax=unclassified Streptomyces TaxID=2593676 RepID=UPI002DD93367|nr:MULTISPECIES: endonuclease/exonuclease/phosphatase family protein [unclassified Streptomyces]WSA95290.1 endonuclease/exonuclease/phosphatase family protein [Streptomyces sp. NBC_01795]WSB79708.1 endonuclease/exonuclease/phosphatase family protein [Streptomyces sp. NBC_01775]WSS12086.1 endonuclease/exonuclease/phosphatase family protein [Streptomyces sp. NBC_01186]WSS40799.1 endonuclease/exonuclease/phosphatase family protein [Streptomyces sp. NBC_01187]
MTRESAGPADLPPSGTEPDGSAVVRLLSYNVRSLRDDREALVRVIRACAPDVVCVQEAPRFFRWRKYASWLGRRTDLTYVAGGATAAGPMILASLRPTVEHAEDVLLPRTPGLHQRGFATAVLRFGAAARLGVVSFHLSLQARERYAQGRALLEQLGSLGEFAVAAGDLNDRPDGRTFRLLADGLQDAWRTAPWGREMTSPAADPVQRIDAVFATKGVRLLGAGVPAGLPGVTPADLRTATDHLPVLAALRVPPAGAPEGL